MTCSLRSLPSPPSPSPSAGASADAWRVNGTTTTDFFVLFKTYQGAPNLGSESVSRLGYCILDIGEHNLDTFHHVHKWHRNISRIPFQARCYHVHMHHSKEGRLGVKHRLPRVCLTSSPICLFLEPCFTNNAGLGLTYTNHPRIPSMTPWPVPPHQPIQDQLRPLQGLQQRQPGRPKGSMALVCSKGFYYVLLVWLKHAYSTYVNKSFSCRYVFIDS